MEGLGGADQPWLELFDDPVQRAVALLPEASRFEVDRRLNGVFAVTADNLPLLGRSTRWRGCGRPRPCGSPAPRALTQAMTNTTGGGVVESLEALHLYNDVYATA